MSFISSLHHLHARTLSSFHLLPIFSFPSAPLFPQHKHTHTSQANKPPEKAGLYIERRKKKGHAAEQCLSKLRSDKFSTNAVSMEGDPGIIQVQGHYSFR